jgi:hypothetical protein
MMIDRQRIAAVRILESMGYAFRDGEWCHPPGAGTVGTVGTDRMHALLVLRADQLAGSIKGTAEEAELEAIADVLEDYEAVRWPDGKVPGGKG